MVQTEVFGLDFRTISYHLNGTHAFLRPRIVFVREPPDLKDEP
jgi:hypothetical protein